MVIQINQHLFISRSVADYDRCYRIAADRLCGGLNASRFLQTLNALTGTIMLRMFNESRLTIPNECHNQWPSTIDLQLMMAMRASMHGNNWQIMQCWLYLIIVRQLLINLENLHI